MSSLSVLTSGSCPAMFFLVAAKSALTHGGRGNSRIDRVLKIGVPSMIDVNKNKRVGKQEVN